jgi:Na+/serine symporter
MLPVGDAVPAGGLPIVKAVVTLNAVFTLGVVVEGVTVVVVELGATLTVAAWELAEA